MPIPFFGDFQKQTKDFWKADKYSFGRQLHLSTQQGDTKLVAKINTKDDNVTTKVSATVKPDWGSIEATQASGKGVQIEAKAPNCYKDLNFTHKINYNYSMETNLKYRQPNNWWNVTMKNVYTPSKNITGNDGPIRECVTTVGVAVGDTDLNLNCGGELVFTDTGPSGQLSAPNTSLTSYRLGFLYTPTSTSGYSLMYKPEKNNSLSTSLLYDFSLYRQCTGSCTVSARAQGRVSTTNGTPKPTVSFGGKFKLANGSIQAFLCSNSSWGAFYQTNITDSLKGTFGISNTSNGDKSTSYKLCFE